jgi:unsaturated chondroitin disaccharide hydrolase
VLEKKWLEDEVEFVYQKVMENIPLFEEKVPPAVSKNYYYEPVENEDWTDGFWIGMLHLCQEYKPNDEIANVIKKQLDVFQNRLDQEIVLNHHDIGFLYSLSAVADYRLNRTFSSREMALQAADVLMRRYEPNSKVIQAWGSLENKEEQGRMIIDCNMNLPLLFFATEETGNQAYKQAAENHVERAVKYLIRDDNSTYHTYHMDVETGEALHGSTAQGNSDNSCWARGQAWGIYGFANMFNYIADTKFVDAAARLADYFIDHLPNDLIAYWDLEFSEGSEEERDTSSSAIMVCGLLELIKQLPISDKRRSVYQAKSIEIIKSLAENYTTKKHPNYNGILVEGVYTKPGNYGVSESTIWGDYFYLEALIRMYQSWYSYW